MPSPSDPTQGVTPAEESFLELLAETLENLDRLPRGQFLQRLFLTCISAKRSTTDTGIRKAICFCRLPPPHCANRCEHRTTLFASAAMNSRFCLCIPTANRRTRWRAAFALISGPRCNPCRPVLDWEWIMELQYSRRTVIRKTF